MPQHKSTEKRARQNNQRRLINMKKRSQIKTVIKKITTAPNKETAQTELKKTVSLLDRMVIHGILHKNKAAHLKSKLTRFVNTLS